MYLPLSCFPTGTYASDITKKKYGRRMPEKCALRHRRVNKASEVAKCLAYPCLSRGDKLATVTNKSTPRWATLPSAGRYRTADVPSPRQSCQIGSGHESSIHSEGASILRPFEDRGMGHLASWMFFHAISGAWRASTHA